MDLDLARVRSFVAVAELRHFGRAAEQLAISQQALSKRLARLEDELGVALVDRGGKGGRGVAPTEAGARFLEPARRALAAADLAVDALRQARPGVRLDVWGHLYAPMRTLARVIEAAPGLDLEPGAGRDLPTVAAAILRGDVDAGFGRVHPMPGGTPHGLTHRLVRLEPVDAVVGIGHPLAGADALRPSDLRNSVLWCPAAVDRLDFLKRFADTFGITEWATGPNLGLEHFVDRLRTDPTCFALLPADHALPAAARAVRSIPLVEPTPLYAWSLLWNADRPHPQLADLLREFGRIGARERWLDHDPTRDWLPDADHTRLTD
ncbi:LysR family transcriptional regulator [Embleya sp. NPDC020886]|uniref:LysR family transcriptional regulator n=1 Tax=Embleya sp. NPDC020886 TaxID=3363980 RepID=UPI0037B09A98